MSTTYFLLLGTPFASQCGRYISMAPTVSKFDHYRGETSNENMEGRDERIAKVKSQIKRHVKTRMLAKEEVSDAMMHILGRDKEWT